MVTVESENRRSALARIVAGGAGLILAALAGLVGVVAAPKMPPLTKRWRKAGSTLDVPANGPMTVVLSARHSDGWFETRQQTVVFIDRDGQDYRVLSGVCTHLGCGVQWNAATSQYKCPCHGGIFDRAGRVVSGPPPRPLDRLNVRVNPQTSDIEVEL